LTEPAIRQLAVQCGTSLRSAPNPAAVATPPLLLPLHQLTKVNILAAAGAGCVAMVTNSRGISRAV